MRAEMGEVDEMSHGTGVVTVPDAHAVDGYQANSVHPEIILDRIDAGV
jgi:hypothetical protein